MEKYPFSSPADRLIPTHALPHLNSRLAQLCPLRELLPGVDVRVLRALEGLLQLVQLIGREGGAAPALLPLQGNAGLGLQVRVVAVDQGLVLHCARKILIHLGTRKPENCRGSQRPASIHVA